MHDHPFEHMFYFHNCFVFSTYLYRPVPRKEDQELLWKVQEKVNVVKEQR